MESKKDIGKFFKENLNSMDFTPNAKVWDGIETELKEKKKKRRIFIWLFFSIFFISSLSIYTVIDFNQSKPLTHPKRVPIKELKLESNSSNGISNGTRDDKSNSELKKTVQSSTNSNQLNNSSNQTKAQLINFKNTSKPIVHETYSNKKRQSNSIYEKKSTTSKTSISSLVKKNNFESQNQKSDATVIISTDESQNNLMKNETISAATAIDTLNKKEKESGKEKKLTEKQKDSSVVVDVKEKENKIIISPYVGITYFNRFGNGNTLNPTSPVIDEGTKSTSNFGILVRWMGREKIGIQTGIGVINNHRFTTVQKLDNNFINNRTVDLNVPLADLQATFENSSQVTFIEENHYFEIPIEGYYIISNKKFGIATAAGMSLFFKNKSDIFMEANGISEFKIGTSKNSSKQSFTVNAKLNVFYTLSKRIQLDLIPEFQFQIMSHKETSNFYPYYLSLKAGISYKL